MTSQDQGSSQLSRAANRNDPGWKYCHSLEENDTKTCVCNFCGKITKRRITRAKERLMGKKGNVAACSKYPKEVRKELWAYASNKKKQDSIEIPNVRDLDLENLGYGDSEDKLDNLSDFTSPTATGRKKVAKKGPMDLFYRKSETTIEKRKKNRLRQTNITEACDKEARARVHQYVARFWYQAGLSFNCIKLKSFQDMLTGVCSFGPNLKAPSYHEIRVPLLNKE